jgi:hypothetical protein
MKLSVAELSKIDFASTHRWSVTLDGIGISTSRGTYIPATNVEEHMNGIESKSVDVGPASYSLPHKQTGPSLSISYIDDKDYTIHLQLRDWIKEAFDKGRIYFSKKKKLTIIKYGLKDEVISDSAYEVLPAFDMKFVGDNNISLLSNSMSLVVLSIIKQ